MDFFTLTSKIEISGVGIHKGNNSTIKINPWLGGNIVLCWEGCGCTKNKYCLQINSSNYGIGNKTSIIQDGDLFIECPEHLFAAFCLLGIRSVKIVASPFSEIPVHPFGTSSYYDMLSREKILLHKKRCKNKHNFSKIHELLSKYKETNYIIEESDNFYCKVILDRPELKLNSFSSLVANKDGVFTLNENNVAAIASSRTWITRNKLNGISIGKGAHLTNWCRILDEDAFSDSKVGEECARHKLYDLIGDLFPLGYLPKLKIIALNPSHRKNNILLKILSETIV